jgi:hypothetical protein
MQFEIKHYLIPDGTSSIVKLTIEAEFTVPADGGPKFAENVVIEIAKRLTGKQEADIRDAIQNQFWLADGERPEEPPA